MKNEWDAFTNNRDIPMEENAIVQYIGWVTLGKDKGVLHWDAFGQFMKDMDEELSGVTDRTEATHVS